MPLAASETPGSHAGVSAAVDRNPLPVWFALGLEAVVGGFSERLTVRLSAGC